MSGSLNVLDRLSSFAERLGLKTKEQEQRDAAASSERATAEDTTRFGRDGIERPHQILP